MGFYKRNKIKVNPGAKSSRFVVDLTQNATAAEAKEKVNNFNFEIETRVEKLAGLDYKKYFNTGKNKIKTVILNYKNNLSKLSAAALAAPKARVKKSATAKRHKLAYGNSRWLNLLDQLAFVGLAKLIFKSIDKICYLAGWMMMFIVRFAYFSLRAFAGLIIKLLQRASGALYPAVVRIFNIFILNLKSALSALPKLMSVIHSRFKNARKEKLERLALKENSPAAEPAYSKAKKLIWDIGCLKPALVFASILLLIVLPVQAFSYYKSIDSTTGIVLGASESAINNLISGGQAAIDFNFNRADENFTAAADNFSTVRNQLGEINGSLFILASVIPEKNIRLASAGKNLAKAGELTASAGKNLSLAASGLTYFRPGDGGKVLANLCFYGRQAVVNLADLSGELNKINSDVMPENYQKQFILLKQQIAALHDGLNEFIGIADSTKIFLGENGLKRYLLIFQNNSELRASGGFIGSYALVDVLDGKIKNIEVPGGGSYDTAAGLLEKIKSPEPLSLIRPDWYFWDANWWPDWPTSAEKLAWFYENSDGSTVDGVIGLTPTVMERILKVIGPIDLKDNYGLIIDADNFWRETQKLAEQKPNITNQPKKIIGDLLNKIIEELPRRLSKDNLLDLAKTVEESLNDKNILFYFTDSGLENKALDLGWGGAMKKTAGDYLNVINTNIGGGKSDRKIEQRIIHRAEIKSDGSIIDNLTIIRAHNGVRGEPFCGARNIDWLRVYVPKGSTLLSASGFKPVDKIFFKEINPSWRDDPEVKAAEASAITDQSSGVKIYNELDKTVFAGWSQVDPGQSESISLKYELPFKLTDNTAKPSQKLLDQIIAKANAVINPEQKSLYAYSLLAQKQPGMNSSALSSELKLADNFKPIWHYPSDLNPDQTGWLINENFSQDKLLGVMAEEN
ncbi:MAG: DUF4012 domain-containing protein [Patescibacteria group bacterium]|nr:DUF4012 domain-containing protein [Patescibacteria group bacterium]